MFVGGGETEDSASAGIDEADAYDAEQAGLTLADVAGMTEVKQRLEAAFLAPMRNPELRRLYGKSLRGGLLLYGPPGCGKTFIARAVAGELGARFIAVSFADIIDMFVGQSERNIHELFEIARRNAPCVLFLDEVDAIGQKRSQLRNTPMRSAVNQLLLELDDISATTRACSCWRPPTTRGTWTARCGVPAGSTGPCSCSRRTPPRARACSATT
jgi:ATPases of the AAA+ class